MEIILESCRQRTRRLSHRGYERYFEKNGKNYHHIIDPSTGYPAENGLTSVTIVSDDGTLADGLSTSLFIMGKEKAEKFWKKYSDKFDVILLTDDDNYMYQKELQMISIGL